MTWRALSISPYVTVAEVASPAANTAAVKEAAAKGGSLFSPESVMRGPAGDMSISSDSDAGRD